MKRLFLQQPRARTQVYLAVNGQQAGPFNKTELQQLVKNGTLTAATLVWQAGMANWQAATAVPEVNKLLLLYTPKRQPASPAPPSAAAQPASNKEPEPHPLRSDLISALAQLGYRGTATAQAVDQLLQAQPDITSSSALKILLSSLR